MEARAHLRYARIAPRKVSVVLDLIRGEDLGQSAGDSAVHPEGRLLSSFTNW